MHENLACFRRETYVFDSLQRAVQSSINRLAVNVHPFTNCLQTLLKLRLNRAVRPRAYIQQEVTAATRNLHQASDQVARTLEIAIPFVVNPGVVDRHARFPKPEVFRLRYAGWQSLRLFWIDPEYADTLGRDPFGNKLLRRLVIGRNSDAVVDERIRLVAVNEPKKSLSVVLFLPEQA